MIKKIFSIITVSTIVGIFLCGCVKLDEFEEKKIISEVVYLEEENLCESGVHSTNLGVCIQCDEYINKYGNVLSDLIDYATSTTESFSIAFEYYALEGTLTYDSYSLFVEAIEIAEAYNELALQKCENIEELLEVYNCLTEMAPELSAAKTNLYHAYTQSSNSHLERYKSQMINYFKRFEEVTGILLEMQEEKLLYGK